MCIMDNLLGITNSMELAVVEEQVTKKRAMELWDNNVLKDWVPGTIDTLQKIHHYLFQDVYDWAGQIRKVNIAKDNFRFAPVRFLDAQLPIISAMPDSTWDEIIEKYVEVNVAHPFREGNGRSGRIWLDYLIDTQLHNHIIWGNITRDEYMEAIRRSHVNSTELNVLLNNHLSNDPTTRSIFAHNVNQSYRYEGYWGVDAENL